MHSTCPNGGASGPALHEALEAQFLRLSNDITVRIRKKLEWSIDNGSSPGELLEDPLSTDHSPLQEGLLQWRLLSLLGPDGRREVASVFSPPDHDVDAVAGGTSRTVFSRKLWEDKIFGSELVLDFLLTSGECEAAWSDCAKNDFYQGCQWARVLEVLASLIVHDPEIVPDEDPPCDDDVLIGDHANSTTTVSAFLPHAVLPREMFDNCLPQKFANHDDVVGVLPLKMPQTFSER